MAGNKSPVNKFQTQQAQSNSNGQDIFQEQTQSVPGIQENRMQSRPGLAEQTQEVEMILFDHVGHNEIDVGKDGSILEADSITIGNREVTNADSLKLEEKPLDEDVVVSPVNAYGDSIFKTVNLSVWYQTTPSTLSFRIKDGVFQGHKDFTIVERYREWANGYLGDFRKDISSGYGGLKPNAQNFVSGTAADSMSVADLTHGNTTEKDTVLIPKASFPLSYKAITEKTLEYETHYLINPFNIPVLSTNPSHHFLYRNGNKGKICFYGGKFTESEYVITDHQMQNPQPSNDAIMNGFVTKNVSFTKGWIKNKSCTFKDTKKRKLASSVEILNFSDDNCIIIDGNKYRKFEVGHENYWIEGSINYYPNEEKVFIDIGKDMSQMNYYASFFSKHGGIEDSNSPIGFIGLPGKYNFEVRYKTVASSERTTNVKIKYATFAQACMGTNGTIYNESSYTDDMIMSMVTIDKMEKNHKPQNVIACSTEETTPLYMGDAEKVNEDCFEYQVKKNQGYTIFYVPGSGNFCEYIIKKDGSKICTSTSTEAVGVDSKTAKLGSFIENALTGEGSSVATWEDGKENYFTNNGIEFAYDISVNNISSSGYLEDKRLEIEGTPNTQLNSGTSLCYVSAVRVANVSDTTGEETYSNKVTLEASPKSLYFNTSVILDTNIEYKVLGEYLIGQLVKTSDTIGFISNNTYIPVLNNTESLDISSLKILVENTNEVYLMLKNGERETKILHCYKMKSIKGGNLLGTATERNNVQAEAYTLGSDIEINTASVSGDISEAMSSYGSYRIPGKNLISSIYFHNKAFIFKGDNTYSDTLSYGASPVQRLPQIIHSAKITTQGLGTLLSEGLVIPLIYPQNTVLEKTIRTMEYVEDSMESADNAVIYRGYLGRSSSFPPDGTLSKQSLILPMTPAVDIDGQFLVAPTLLKHEYGIDNLDDYTGIGSDTLALQKPYIVGDKGIYESLFAIFSKGKQVLDVDNDGVYQLQNIVVFTKKSNSLVFMYTEAGFIFQYSLPNRVIMNPIKQGESIIFVTNKGIYSYMGDPILLYSYDFGTPFKGTLSLIDDKYSHIILMLNDDEHVKLHTLKLGVGNSISDLGEVSQSLIAKGSIIKGYIETSDWEEIKLVDSEENVYEISYTSDLNGAITSRPISLTQGGKVFNLQKVYIYGKNLNGDFMIVGDDSTLTEIREDSYARTVIACATPVDFIQYKITINSGELYRVRFVGSYIGD